MRQHVLSQYDRTRALELTLYNPNGTRCDLTNADSVRFWMQHRKTGFLVVNYAEMEVDDAALGQVSYHWETEDVDEYGEYDGKVAVYWDDDADDPDIESFPNGQEEFIPIYITRAPARQTD